MSSWLMPVQQLRAPDLFQGCAKMLFLIPAADEFHAKVMLASTLDMRSRESGRNLCWGRGSDACCRDCHDQIYSGDKGAWPPRANRGF